MDFWGGFKNLLISIQCADYVLQFHCYECGKNFKMVSKREVYDGYPCKHCGSRSTRLINVG